MLSSDACTLQILPTEEGNEPKLCGCPVPSSDHLPLRPLLKGTHPPVPPGTFLGLCHSRWSCTAGLAPHTYNHPCSQEQGIIITPAPACLEREGSKPQRQGNGKQPFSRALGQGMISNNRKTRGPSQAVLWKGSPKTCKRQGDITHTMSAPAPPSQLGTWHHASQDS